MKVQGKFREFSEKVHRRFRESSGNFQRRFIDDLGNAQLFQEEEYSDQQLDLSEYNCLAALITLGCKQMYRQVKLYRH